MDANSPQPNQSPVSDEIENETQDPSDQEPQFPLAFDADGDPIEVPPEAVRWRVRKMAARAGRPRSIFDPETGRQLEIPITADVHVLAERVDEPGRYRLEAVDAEGIHIVGCVALTEVCPSPEERKQAARMGSGDTVAEMTALVKELVSTNSRVMVAMASAFGNVKPAPTPVAPDPRPDNAPQPEANPNVVANVVSAVTQLMSMVTSGKIKLEDMAKLAQ